MAEINAAKAKQEPKKEEVKKEETKKEDKKSEKTEDSSVIDIEDFMKVKLICARIISAEPVEKSDKLLKIMVADGQGERQIVSGIAKSYSPEQLVGKKVILVSNLKPAKLRGVLSEGMVLCSEDKDGNLALISPEKDMPAGSEIG